MKKRSGPVRIDIESNGPNQTGPEKTETEAARPGKLEGQHLQHSLQLEHKEKYP